jgi:hypothetical protein
MLVGASRHLINRGETLEAAKILSYIENHPKSNEEAESGAKVLLDQIKETKIELDWQVIKESSTHLDFNTVVNDVLLDLK